MQERFGQFINEAKEGLTAFKRQEDYLDSLSQAYTGLIRSIAEQINAQEATSKNLVQMSDSFKRVRQMKGLENSQLTESICGISNPLESAAEASTQVATAMKSDILPILDYNLRYLQEAMDTFLRWRAIVTRFYTLVNAAQKN